ncbi:hypothetical protein JCM8097_005357 [Rhodosporidiobolus ruineniae]
MTDTAPAAAATAPVCCVCGAQPAQRCSRCHPHRSSYYCSAACQKLVWSYHKQVCGKDEPYFPFPNLEPQDRIYVKISCAVDSPVCHGKSLEFLIRYMLPPSPDQDIDYLIDDFLNGRKQVVQSTKGYPLLALVDEKPVFPLLGWMYGHLYAFKHFGDDPSYRNPFALTAYTIIKVLSLAMSSQLSKEDLPVIEEFPEAMKPFLDTVFVFAVLLQRWHNKETPRPANLTRELLDGSLDRIRARAAALPLSRAAITLWHERSKQYGQLQKEIDEAE